VALTHGCNRQQRRRQGGGMALQTDSPRGRPGIQFVRFNQDGSCVALGTRTGIKVYSRHSHSLCYENPLGAVSIVEMLFCSSIVAFVGTGEQPALSPRRMSVLNTSSGRTIQDIHFTTSVLAVHMNRQRLVVLLESKAFVYSVSNLTLLRAIDLPPGGGVRAARAAALTTCDSPSLLALPAAGDSGVLRVYDLLFDGGSVLCEAAAHSGPLEALAWSHDGSLLASASTKGTVIRVHRMPTAARLFQLRRGTRQAQVRAQLALLNRHHQCPSIHSSSPLPTHTINSTSTFSSARSRLHA